MFPRACVALFPSLAFAALLSVAPALAQVPTPAPANQPRPTFAPPRSRPPLLKPDEYIPVSRLRGGMQGYGLSVFQGNRIEKFDVKILGVVKKANNGRDLILVKLGGPQMRRVTDVIAGMSGSPVYVNGKIVGAVAYGQQFTRESIGYLTPIEDMVDAWDTSLPQSAFDNDTPPGLKRLSAKVTVSGVSGSRMTKVAGMLAKIGLEARQGGGRAPANLTASPLTPGGAIAMSLATGDIDITAVGTLTYRRGNQIVAFGHPFLGIGPLDAPMFSAYIHDIEPSFSESSKIGSPVKMVGAFSQDRPFSVGGKIGVMPRLIPITVRIDDRAMGKQKVFRAQLMRHPQLTPTLADIAAGTAIAEVHGQPGDVMATVTTEVLADGVGKLTHTTRVFEDTAVDEAAVGDLRNLLGLMSGNPFYPVNVRSVNLTVKIEPGRKTAQVERIFLRQSRFAPGDLVQIGVVMKPFKKPSFVRNLSVRIPANAPAGTLLLTVQGGASSALSGLVALLTGARAPEYQNAGTVEQLLHKWEERDRGDQLIARLTLPTGAINVRGEKLDGLPANIEAAMRAGMNRTSGARLERDEVKVAETTDYVVSGAQVLPVQVVRTDIPATLPSGFSTPSTPTGGTIAPPPSGSTFAPPPGSAIDVDELVETRSTAAPSLPVPSFAPPADPAVPTRVTAAPPPSLTGPVASPVVSAPPTPSAPSTAVSVPVGRQPGVWRQATATDFRAGTLNGVSVSETGQIAVAPRLVKITESDEPFFWSVCPDGQGGVYAGSGDRGIVYHVSASGERTVLAETGEVSVHALTRGANGVLYAGTSPHGRIVQITPDGKSQTLVQTAGKHILSFALSPGGRTLYAAVGGSREKSSDTGAARVYAINLPAPSQPGASGLVPSSPPVQARLVYQGAGDAVSALALSGDGTLYAGVAPTGQIVQVNTADNSDKTGKVLYDVPESSFSGLIAGSGGTLYAATAPRGQILRFAPGAAMKVLYERPLGGAITALSEAPTSSAGDSGLLYAAGGATVISLQPEAANVSETIRTFEATSDIQILALAPNINLSPLDTDALSSLWAATGSVGGVYALRAPTPKDQSSSRFLSSVLDTHAVSQWGTVRFASSGGTVSLETRSGNTPEPDASWSQWSSPYTQGVGGAITSPPARFLQYRATLNNGATLQSVEAFYLPPNQAPQLALVSPRGGEVWRGAQTVRWTANDPDRDTLSFEVMLSGDGGKTWQPAPSGKAITTGASPASALTAPTASAASPTNQVQAELAKHPEISAEMKAKILSDASAGTVAPAALPATRDTSASLDTSRLADSTYIVRVRASDRLANPTGALVTERVSGTFRVLNHAPVLTLTGNPAEIAADRTIHIQGTATHPTPGALIRGVQFRVDSGEWTAATPTDGIFDGTSEAFTLTTAALTPGTHTVEVQAQDEAGNVATQKIPVTVR